MSDRVIIYIRHGEDKSRNYKYKYDPKLTRRGKDDAKELTEKLLKQYGVPDVIYFSPYARTRQTLKHMLRIVSKHSDKKIKKIVDHRLSRFFTRKQKRNPDIREKTRYLGAPIYETWDDFKDRVADQLEDMEEEIKSNNVIWCVGHTLIIKLVAKYRNIDKDKYITYLDTVVLMEK